MKIFVTGGTGFIGSHFLNQAHAAGHQILALRRTPDSLPRIPLVKEPDWLDKEMAAVTVAELEGCDTVIHLAAHSANVPYDTLENCVEANVLAPLRLFRTAIASGISRFIVAGSCFEYGRAGERYEFIPTDAPLEPTASYPASKAAASVAFHALACEQSLEMIIFRIFQVYGEGEAISRFWPSLRCAALAGKDFPMSQGLQVRDFIHVSDVASAFVDALQQNDVKPGSPLVHNLGSGIPRSLGDFAELEWSRHGATGRLKKGAFPMRVNEVMRLVPEI